MWFFFIYIYIGLSQSHVTDRELRGLIWVDHGVFFSVVFFNWFFFFFIIQHWIVWKSLFYSMCFIEAISVSQLGHRFDKLTRMDSDRFFYPFVNFFLISSFNIWFAGNWVLNFFFILLSLTLSLFYLIFILLTYEIMKILKKILR